MSEVERLWNIQLAKAIAALNTPALPRKIVELFALTVPFDCCLILGFSQRYRPSYIYDSLTEQRDMLFDTYLSGAYTLDPFYNAYLKGISSGIYRLADISPDLFKKSEYYKTFYSSTGWREETGIIVNISEDLTIAIFLGRLQGNNKLNRSELIRLKSIEPIIHNLCKKHWNRISAGLDNQTSTGTSDITIKQHIDTAFEKFGTKQLTPREREVVRLILMGHSSRSVADRLSISEGTVKNHRKSIHTKLKITSQSELFTQFLNFLITA